MQTMILKVIIVTKEMYETNGESKYLSNDFAKSILQPFRKWEDKFSIIFLRCFKTPPSCRFEINSGPELAYELLAAINPEVFLNYRDDSLEVCDIISDGIRFKLKGMVQTINSEFEYVFKL